ncbi:hypothetical protein KY284_030070 [Solanum tuberosum]|nr:hypothetical protein KY284_030070 [Solanum tuberosum]
MGHSTGEVTNMKRLDHVVMELKEHLVSNRESGRETTPMQQDGPSAATLSEERIHRPMSPTSYSTHNSNFSRWPRMEVLRFSGEDLRSWLFKIEQFFFTQNVTDEEKGSIATLQLEGEAIQWHLSFMRYSNTYNLQLGPRM